MKSIKDIKALAKSQQLKILKMVSLTYFEQ